MQGLAVVSSSADDARDLLERAAEYLRAVGVEVWEGCVSCWRAQAAGTVGRGCLWAGAWTWRRGLVGLGS
eukprot:243738-Chlamydomonas_euryale.AAC.1